MKAYGKADVQIYSLLILALAGGVVNFTPWPLYSQYSLDRGLVRPQGLCGRRGEEKFLDTTGTRTPSP
jgi:hypothetical protein